MTIKHITFRYAILKYVTHVTAAVVCNYFSNASALIVDSAVSSQPELQKRLVAFERAGVEKYLHKKRCEDEGKIEKKADCLLQK